MLYKDISVSIVRKADTINPRHSESSILTRKNGDLLLVWQRFEKSVHGTGDQAPSTIPMISSADGGDTWREEGVLVEQPDDCVNVYSPNLMRYRWYRGRPLLSHRPNNRRRMGSGRNEFARTCIKERAGNANTDSGGA